jgi:hypothetical protein
MTATTTRSLPHETCRQTTVARDHQVIETKRGRGRREKRSGCDPVIMPTLCVIYDTRYRIGIDSNATFCRAVTRRLGRVSASLSSHFQMSNGSFQVKNFRMFVIFASKEAPAPGTTRMTRTTPRLRVAQSHIRQYEWKVQDRPVETASSPFLT